MYTELRDILLGLKSYSLAIANDDRRLFAAALAVNILGGFLEGIGLFLLVPILDLIGVGGPVTGTYPLAASIRDALGSLGVTPTIGPVLGIFLVLMLLRGAVNYLAAILAVGLSYGFQNRLRLTVYRAISDANWLYLARRMSSQFTQAFTTQTERAASGANMLIRLVATLLSICAGTVVALTVSPLLTFAAVVFAIAVFIPISAFDVRAHRLGREGWRVMQAMFEQLDRHLGSLKSAKILSAERQFGRAFAELSGRYSATGIALVANDAKASFFHSAASAAVLCGFIYIAVTYQAVALEPVLLAVVFARLLPRFQEAQGLLRDLAAILPEYKALNALVSEAQAASEATDGGRTGLRLNRELSFVSVSFRYGADTPLVLENISLDIKARSSLGLVGISGSGKTTLADLAAGLFPPSAGRILVDGEALQPADLRGWRRRVAYVAQDEFLFNDTLRANLTIAHPAATEQQIAEALVLAHAETFVAALPKGLDMVIGDRGILLSRGQRQRICLARALVGMPDLLILDEATSALNPVDEQHILAALKDISARVAVLAIAHRISSVAWTEKLAVLGSGHILDMGNTADLLARDGGLVRAMLNLDLQEPPAGQAVRP